jgi:hypothetical protein
LFIQTLNQNNDILLHGLGLYLIWKMVEVYGWKITEKPVKGATFVITTPKGTQPKKENSQILT